VKARAVVDAKYAGHASDHTTDHAANETANGAGGTFTVAGAALDPSGHALRVGNNWQRHGGD
jgi:hypothetical protein